jgi:hypothetical protein
VDDGLRTLLLFLANQHPSYVAGFFLITFCSPVGFAVLAFQAWRKDSQKQQKMMDVFRLDMDTVLEKYGDHVRQLGRQYENNVELVKTTHTIASDYRDLLATCIQANTRLADVIEKNQFCPAMRKG